MAYSGEVCLCLVIFHPMALCGVSQLFMQCCVLQCWEMLHDVFAKTCFIDFLIEAKCKKKMMVECNQVLKYIFKALAIYFGGKCTFHSALDCISLHMI